MIKQKLVALTGAGISAESGLKTFRDNDGLWMGYNVYEVATPGGFKKNPQLVLDFYNQRRREVAAALPNAAHKGLAELEKYFDVTVITQNIDDLHERGGSSDVLHLHGEIFKMRSIEDEENIFEIKGDINLGDTAADGHQLRPHIVWFEEPVPMIEKAAAIVASADIFVVIGTSLQVYPAAGLMELVQEGAKVFVIDRSLPLLRNAGDMVLIEKPATEGVQEMINLLIPNK